MRYIILIFVLFYHCLATASQNLVAKDTGARLPTKRQVFGSVIYDGADSLYIFGGYLGDTATNAYSSEILRYGFNNALEAVGHFPSGICCGTVINGNDPGTFLYFGGETEQGGDSSVVFK